MNLNDWLGYIESTHPSTIDLSLERIKLVAKRLNLNIPFPLITVGGTNGKGSTCAILESIYKTAGYKVGCYTSPHFLLFNERIKVDAQPISDHLICDALLKIESVREDVSLTYFEYGTLAAMIIFAEESIDVAILEIGLGGRLDAVNIFEPDCSIVTTVDLDHMDYLGETREAIGFEKAGIYRANKSAICGDFNPPKSLIQHAESIHAPLKLIGKHFNYELHHDSFDFLIDSSFLMNVPLPNLQGNFQIANASMALMAVKSIEDKLPVNESAIQKGIASAYLLGRFQEIQKNPSLILDVAHNPQAALSLSHNLRGQPIKGKTIAVFSILADKDILGVVRALSKDIDDWYISMIQHERAASVQMIEDMIKKINPSFRVMQFKNIQKAYQFAFKKASENDRIIVFGSFFTVADIMRIMPKL
ncbi:MAG: bifunctional tetrahydrofolate synthase/dihydrofolate synthase [Candidatus Methylopumilus sp.]|nr:bifunctional tetrahydrofolate synthase/dihydrofolate synthase [Candidatus Methylopumilus sp.]